jgi:DNA-binding MarR family transcriptional regulator/ribosomal protein S18 acetylase RimI-like enzyme
MSVCRRQAEQVRDFNRFYTQAIGVVTDHYLGQLRPLSEARVLFEVGVDGADVRDLRARLRLDSGYMSRLLRALESAGLIRTQPSSSDSRVHRVELTHQGQLELEDLNERAASVASELLEPLSERKRAELLEAMALIKRYFRLAAIEIGVIDPELPEAQQSLATYATELAQRFPEGYSPTDLLPAAYAREPEGLFVAARDAGHVVGCGVLRTPQIGHAEIRHLWVDPGARDLGLGRRLVRELELLALVRDYKAIRLDTHRALTEAIALYRSAGYEQIAAYDDNPHAHLWFEKSLGETPSSNPARR